jgi:two-component system phosphate regulon sensor histidine kinase PhoR
VGRIFARLFLNILLLTSLVLILTSAFTYRQLDANYQSEANQSQVRLAHIVTAHFQALWPLEGPAVDGICKRLLQDPAMRLTVIAPDGTVLGDSDADPAKMANHRTPDRPEVLAALAGQAGADVRTSGTLGVPYRYVALPLSREGKVVAAVRLAIPVKAIAEGERFIRNTTIWLVLAGIGSAAVLGLITAWIWHGPLRRIARTARQVASGGFASEDGRGPHEQLSDLAESLQELGSSLGRSLAQIVAGHRDLLAALGRLPEGVAATDAEGRVLFLNAAAEGFLSVEAGRVAGTPLATLLPSLEMQEFQEHALASGQEARRRFEVQTAWGRRSLEFRAAGLPAGPSRVRCLLVMRDVTGEGPPAPAGAAAGEGAG